MKNMVDIMQKLRSKLLDFGRSKESISVIKQAIEANKWFTHSDICRSVDAITSQMLEPSKLLEWIDSYPTLPATHSRRIAIIMAGNIPLVGFFDLLCTLMAGHKAWVKPSSKDRILMDYICELLREIEPLTPIYIYNDQKDYDAIIATGGDEANKYFEQRFAQTKRLCRGNRHSIAVLSGNESAKDLELLTEDIYSYSGLGCRNVAMIFAPKRFEVQLPQYATSPKYRNNYLQTRAMLTLRGETFSDNGSSIVVKSQKLPTSLSSLSLYEYTSLSEVEEWIRQHEGSLQCIVSHCINHPRCVSFGQAQHPTLFDYADSIDTMRFLEFN